jgi:monovalent cation/proton antiporter MnhG/PhaG subunit
MKESVELILLLFGAGVCFLSALGILVMRNVYDKLHYLSPMSTLGTAALAAAVVVDEGFTSGAVKSILIAILLFVSSPVLTQATARAAQCRESRESNREEETTP